MSHRPTLILCALAYLVLNGAAMAATPGKGFDGAFGLLKTRNIFDPQRQPGGTAPPQSAAPVARTDFAALTGIMVAKEKVLAFFSGSRPEYNAVVAPNGMIAGAVIKRIAPDFIEIERDGKIIPITVGKTVPLSADSTSVAAPAITNSVTSSVSLTSTPASVNPGTPALPNTSPSAPPTPNREALIRRMMEKRQQELR